MIKKYIKKCVEESLKEAFGRSYSLNDYHILDCTKEAFTHVIESKIDREIGEAITEVIKGLDLKAVLTTAIEEHIKEKYKISMRQI